MNSILIITIFFALLLVNLYFQRNILTKLQSLRTKGVTLKPNIFYSKQGRKEALEQFPRHQEAISALYQEIFFSFKVAICLLLLIFGIGYIIPNFLTN